MCVRILVLGSKGMLGRYIKIYLSKFDEYTVDELNRDKFDPYKEFTQNNLIKRLKDIYNDKYHYIINCIGVTNKRDVTDMEMFVVNSYLPYMLAVIGTKYNSILIHPTTDCVYSGLDGPYCSTDIPDCTSNYGLSKFLGENVNLIGNVYVIRASIIGEGGVGSLIEWVKSNNNKIVNGYTNHYWNGITCLEYAKQIKNYINTPEKIFPTQIDFIRSSYNGKDKISKYDLVKEISNIYDLNITVNPFETPTECDRSLVAKNTGDIIDQIKEMKVFGEKYFD